MYVIKELVNSITYQLDYTSAFYELIKKLNELHIRILTKDENKGEIVACCLSKLMNIIVWKCWSDKLVFEIKEEKKDRTRINIYAIPNLLRIKVNKDEQVTDLDKLIILLREKTQVAKIG